MAQVRSPNAVGGSLLIDALNHSVSDRLRTPIRDWYETLRNGLEKAAREARSVHRQQARAPAPELLAEAPDAAEGEDAPEERSGLPSIAGISALRSICRCDNLVLSERSISVLHELEQRQADIEAGRAPTREDAVWFQPKLAALVAFTGGGVLRPGSVSGMFFVAYS